MHSNFATSFAPTCEAASIPGRLALLDVETTGADPRRDRITELGVLLVDDGAVIEEWATLVNPGRTIPPGIQTLTGITCEMVDGAPAFEDVAMELARRIDGRLLVAHNARFDYAFLRNEFRRAALPYRSEVLCTVRLSRALFPEHPKHNLDALIERFGLACDGRHRALSDARLLLYLLRAVAARVEPEKFSQAVAEVVQAPRAPPGVDPDLIDDLPDAPGVYVLFDETGTTLYVGRAANLRQQVLTHFADTSRHAPAQRAAIRERRIEWQSTAGELGASLHQLRRVEAEAPLHNRPPRGSREAWALHWHPDLSGGSSVVPVDLNANDTPDLDLFGPFRSRADALAALRGLTREHGLCAVAVGLESPGQACSGVPRNACAGVCEGRETHARHAMRLMQALQRLRLPAWPYPGLVALVEEDSLTGRQELHVLDRWRHLASVANEHELGQWLERRASSPRFDVDVFRLLRRAVERGNHRLRRLDAMETRER